MCGIYALLSPARLECAPLAEDFFDRLDGVLESSIDSGESARALAQLFDDLRAECYRLVDRSGMLQVLADGRLRERLEDAAGRIVAWVERLEQRSVEAPLESQGDIEALNGVIVAARDLAWQIERDILASVAPIRALCGAGERAAGPFERPDDEMQVLGHAWALNLVLDTIDRLEVRGRDSAGLAVALHFTGASAIERFADELGGLREEFEHRVESSPAARRAILRPEGGACLMFTFKVAEEVGEMGDNVRALRAQIAGDAVFQRAMRWPGTDAQILAHTRWASNGIVSIENCHPVDSSIRDEGGILAESRGAVLAVLNGDIDNYHDLYEKYVTGAGVRIDEGITTDAKIIPVVIASRYRESGDAEEAFRRAFDEFEGSMAIGVMFADRPGEFLFGQKGSGQGLFIGLGDVSVCVASEMYGVVELTQCSIKAEGEGKTAGEIFHLRRTRDRVEVSILDASRRREVPPERVRRAEITTRDINRGGFPRFFLKEISESVESARKTIRGKYEITADGEPAFHLGPEVLDPARLAAFRSGKVRKVLTIGQGTAAIAADGIASLLERALRGAATPIHIQSVKAAELSGHQLRDDMSDTLVIAVSQSGTTTDTNRTVDMARERGAWILAIVNRRNSDLVYKSHGVHYTSDGRDIEMSVASTKAFYAQNVAGQILALALAHSIGALPATAVRRELQHLDSLPAAMERTLALGDQVAELARALAGRRRHWAIVGSGLEKIAANEIRIKLSELCYKSIACDFTEDKKHIDLSSEPFVLVCAAGTPPSMVSDVVKEVAIFKAHQSLPVVITRQGETRFDPYASGTVKIPEHSGALGYLLTTMVGHLFGYHAAASFDAFATRLRALRTAFVGLERQRREGSSGGIDGGMTLPDELVEDARELREELLDGALDGCLGPASAIRLAFALHAITGKLPAGVLAGSRGGSGAADTILAALSEAISELARPIDAIKHQAKTVTVGISRAEEAQPEGAILAKLRELDPDLDRLAEANHRLLAAFEPVIDSVDGITVYRVEGLDAAGRPRDGSTATAVQKSGWSAAVASRSDSASPLTGTKWGVVRSREAYLGYGQNDGRRILIVPLIGEANEGHIVLFHVSLKRSVEPETLRRALAANPRRLEAIRIAITERCRRWDPELLDAIDTETLFLESPERVAEEVLSRSAVG